MVDRANNSDTATHLGVEATRCQTADALCTTMDAAEDHHIILGFRVRQARAREGL